MSFESLCQKKYKIGVVGIGRGAGATFVSMSLAFLLAKEGQETKMKKTRNLQKRGHSRYPALSCITYVECQPPKHEAEQAYYIGALDKRFEKMGFVDFFQLHREGGFIGNRINLHKGINWVVHRNAVWEDSQIDRIWEDLPLDQLAGDVIVADSPALETLQSYDLILGTVDPLPSKIFAGAGVYEALRDLQVSGLPILWILNKDNEQVNHDELRRFLKWKDYIKIPLFPQELFYKSQYLCQLAIETLLQEKKGENPFDQLLDLVAQKKKFNEDFMK